MCFAHCHLHLMHGSSPDLCHFLTATCYMTFPYPPYAPAAGGWCKPHARLEQEGMLALQQLSGFLPNCNVWLPSAVMSAPLLSSTSFVSHVMKAHGTLS